MPTLILGTRRSQLARWQTDHVAELLCAAWPGLTCRIEPFVTRGDQSLDKPLPEIGGKGLFTAELEAALRAGTIDLAIHSLKDLPVQEVPGLTIGAIVGRADVRDVLVARNGWTLETLPPGAVVGTSSVRRQAQLQAYRPDLTFRSIRGNVETRIRKVLSGEYDATVLAAAGVQRLGLDEAVSQWLPLDVMLPAPGQGALAVQCRANDTRTLELLAAIDNQEVRKAVTAERAFLQALGGGCSAPVAAWARQDDTGLLVMDALLASQPVASAPGGRPTVARARGRDAEPHALARRLAEEVRGRLDAAAAPRGLPSSPLQGKRVVITRAAEQAGEFSQRLRSLGAVPMEIPTIQIVAVDDLAPFQEALQRLASYDWILFTSANGVQVFWEQATALGLPTLLHAEGSRVRVAAVGPATAQALAERGIPVDFVPARHTGEALAAALEPVQGCRILLPRAARGRPEVAEILQARGARVDDLPIYQTVPAPIDAASIQALAQGVDVITFTSGSTARHFVAALGQGPSLDLATLCRQAVIACIGPVTAQTAGELGLPVHVVAEEHSVDGLIQALVAYFEEEGET